MSELPTSTQIPALKCPVCSSRFRDRAVCPRCATDLTAMMRIASRAWNARQRCGAALLAGDLDAALRWSTIAEKLHSKN